MDFDGYVPKVEAALRPCGAGLCAQCSASKLAICQIPSGLLAGETAGAGAFLNDRLCATSARDGLPAPLPQIWKCSLTRPSTHKPGVVRAPSTTPGHLQMRPTICSAKRVIVCSCPLSPRESSSKTCSLFGGEVLTTRMKV